jgi:uncharacterized membrane protein
MTEDQKPSQPNDNENPAETKNQTMPGQEPVWTFRGYRLKSSEFTTAMVHFFRAEISRANVWRQRLDTTTNWAVIATGAAITIAFNQTTHHGVIILNTILVTLFLMIEARRYRYYELWSYRVRLMETDFFAPMLVPPFHPAPDWAESLAENLLHPDFSISMWEALGRRFRRNYLWIYLVLGVAWLAKTCLFPTTVTSLNDFFTRAAVGGVPGWIVLLAGLLFNLSLVAFGLLTSGLHQATGEVLPRYTADLRGIPLVDSKGTPSQPARAWYRFGRKRQQLVALIVTQHGSQVGDQILKEMQRGVTALRGTGMFTSQERTVLLCALTVTEVSHLKSIVYHVDPKAFVIVTPAQEVLGKGFLPLEPDE